jgi:predicted membrane protein
MKHMISIWFFIGGMLALCGPLILFAGIADYSSSSSHTEVLHQLHLPIWWGCIMTVLGVASVVHFRPKR